MEKAHIRTFGCQKKQCTSNNEDTENTGPQAIPAVPCPKLLQNCTFLQHAIPLNTLGLDNINTEVTRQIASVESEQVKWR